MSKNNTFFAVLAAFVLIFCLGNVSFATEIDKGENLYPDYSMEFVGKDTCEKFNRKLFVFNLKVNKYVVRPINIVWASVMPKYGMERIVNVYTNMNYPVRLAGCLLQKDFRTSGQETVRFLTNTTIGLAGMYDPAQSLLKIEPHQEDLEQALDYHKVKKGPYLVLPVVRGNVRDLAGKLLACPLRPTFYAGPFGAAANAVFAMNYTAYMQPLFKKVDESYPDPYEIVKQVDGIDKYIKNNNLDRSEVYLEKIASQGIPLISKAEESPEVQVALKQAIQPDIRLENFNAQSSLVDSMRTAMFDNQKIDSSIWSEMSVWNKTFCKKMKISSVSITPDRQNYRYRYILQKDKSAPLAIIYPSIGESIMADKSSVLAKMLYDEGYSVMIQGSPFHWEFIKSMPADYRPGLPSEDAKYLRQVSVKIIDDLQKKKGIKFEKKILVGCSFGALTGIFTAEQEHNENTLGISNYICICPPVDIFFALRQLDKYAQDWKNSPDDIKSRTALATEKIMRTYKNISQKDVGEMPEAMPFTDDEAKLIIGFLMKQKLSDVIFTIENRTRCQKCDLYETINKTSFSDYSQKYVFANQQKSSEEAEYDSSLYSLSKFLKESKNYKIYHSLDDYYTNREQLSWLKKISDKKSVYFSNGSHLGFMYRKEFVEQFKKDIKLPEAVSDSGL